MAEAAGREEEQVPGGVPLLLEHSLELQDLICAVFQLPCVVICSPRNTSKKGARLFIRKRQASSNLLVK